MSKTRLMTAATTALAGLLLTGCGSAAPGVAVKVGDEELTVRHVDSVTEHYCAAVGDLESEVPMGFVRQYVVQLLTLRSQASQIADQYGVEPGSTYYNDVAQRQGTAGTKPEEVRDDYVELASTTAYAQDILDQVGRIRLEDQGVADPTAEQVTQAGIDVFNQWPDANGIEIDPRYGLEAVDGVLSPVDTNTSVAVGDTARSGLETEPDPAFAATLPVNHRCG
ncbi:hypothetical protein F4692_000604 [Nocardioides cavernae]|uniref:Uncharacterized protein n=1 Tax=Nocardioides cavernae TaxID=1921566 RepID=A0A7Y9KQE2_9ACTN|nr:hypothetical protein [Nocardioides cavernae]NYE35500.1 hypothetical protein [Nocardioides cavernae]